MKTVAFTEGKRLDEIEQARESGKRPYQRILLVKRQIYFIKSNFKCQQMLMRNIYNLTHNIKKQLTNIKNCAILMPINHSGGMSNERS